MSKICGIYKIVSPSKKIYIGQSVNIKRRWTDYKSLNCKKQRRLFHSLNKYGYKKHKFSILTQCEYSMLDELELFYIDLFEATGKNGLNSMRGTKWTKKGISILRKSMMGGKNVNASSKYIGVRKNKYNQYTTEFIGFNNERIYLGTYKDEISAAYSHDLYCKKNPNLNRVLNFTDVELKKLKEVVSGKNEVKTTSIYKGVHKHADGGYISQLPPSANNRYIGTFKDEISAAYAFDIEIIERRLDETLLNFTVKERRSLASLVSEKNSHRIKNRYKGIYKYNKTGKWVSRITVNNKVIFLGYHITDTEAAQAYNDYVINNNLNRKLNVIE
jgi:group I intron endonuclease